MSEAERRKRDEYRKNRKKWITVLTALIALVSAIALVFAVLYYRVSKNTYISYTEDSNISYKVNYKPNQHYPNGPDNEQAYVSSLVDSINTDFTYSLKTESEEVEYEYSYVIDVQTAVKNKDGKVLWSPTETYKESAAVKQSGKSQLIIADSVTIPFEAYYTAAEQFVNDLGLENTKSELTVTMQVTVLSICKDFDGERTSNTYFTSMKLPLMEQTFGINITESVGEAQKQILATENSTFKTVFGRMALGGLFTDIALAVLLILFVYLTRNTDINYTIKVKRIVSSYKSYIQKIYGEFDSSGYQVVFIDSFREMLEIRDTIQSPILMSENTDRTCTRFIIPTATKLLYVNEIKVEDYDEIYAEAEESAEEPALPEAAEEPAVEAFVPATDTTDTVPQGGEGAFDDSEFGKYDYSFEARLALSDEGTRSYYSEIIAFSKSYGVKVARSWKRERIYFGRKTFANFTFKAQRLSLALALDPKTQDEKYGFIDMSESGKYEKTPALMKLTSQRKKKYAIELLGALFTEAGLTDKELGIEPEYVPYRSKLLLIKLGLIKTSDAAQLQAAMELAIPEELIEAQTEAAETPKADEIEIEGVALLDMSELELKKTDIEEAIASPDVVLEEIDFVKEEPELEMPENEEEEGVEVIGVVWPEKAHRNKIYKYDPNGEILHEGDVVLAPSKDKAKNKDVVRKAAVAQGNHKVAPELIHHPLKKIIGIVKRRTEAMLTPSDEKIENLLKKEQKNK